jgi:hypothetical protein
VDYDLFLSYKSEDRDLARRLKDDLERRGVRVWLDQDDIRPGDEFPDALQDGVQTSNKLGLLVTPESLRSKWVQHEIMRARQLEVKWKQKIIPLLFRDSELPKSLDKCQQIDFRSEDDFARSVNKLVWPGITGKKVIFIAVHPGHTIPWITMAEGIRDLGFQFVPGEDIDRAWRRIKEHFGRNRVVVVVDPFEDWPHAKRRRNGPQQYAEWILSRRERTMETPDKLVFLLHHHSGAWEAKENAIDASSDTELRRFYAIHQDMNRGELMEALQENWYRIQRDLLEVERAF